MTGRPGRRLGRAVATLAVVVASVALPAASAAAAAAPSVQKACAAPPNSPVVILLLDNHRSWPPPAGIPSNRIRAARLCVDYLPQNALVGLITFNAGWHWQQHPTANHQLVIQALQTAQAAGKVSTGIYNAISAAESEIKGMHPAAARLVIVSNAENVHSNASFKPSVPVDVLPFRYDNDDNISELNSLARYSRGQVGPTNAGSPTKRPRPAPTPAATHRSTATARTTSGLLIGGLACIFLALLLAALVFMRPVVANSSRRLAGKIERYGPQHAPAAEPEGEGKAARTALGVAASMLRSTNTEQGLARRLDWAGIARSPAEWTLLTGCGCVVLAATLTLATGNALLGVPVGVLIGWLVVHLVVSFRIGRRRAAFSEQLPDTLQLIAGSLQSGFSLAQALDAVVRENSQPAAGEFSRALAEARIGANLEDALDRVADRMSSTDLHLTVMAIRIQREVGGNLAEVLLTTVATMRERAYLRRQVKALSAEGRLSSYILIALPILVGGWFFYVDPKYMSLLYTTVPGVIMSAGCGVLLVVGVFWMRKLIDIEV